MMKLLAGAAIALALTALAPNAHSQEYEGYVPPFFAEAGLTYPDLTAAQILSCDVKGLKTTDLDLNPAGVKRWFGFCAKANPVLRDFKANNCLANRNTAACRTVERADDTIREQPGFWEIVNAMEGRFETYGLDD